MLAIDNVISRKSNTQYDSIPRHHSSTKNKKIIKIHVVQKNKNKKIN